MSQRPRLAGDGQLLLPDEVAFDRRGFLTGHLSDRTVNPFEWTADRLLLAESFARLDLADQVAAEQWFSGHGAVDRFAFVGRFVGRPTDYWLVGPTSPDLTDHAGDLEAEQANVSWHLITLARLSEHRETRDWNPTWGQLAIDSPDGEYIIVGGPDAGAVRLPQPIIDALQRSAAADPTLQRRVDEATRLLAATKDWPTIAVGGGGWIGYWRNEAGGVDLFETHDEVKAAARVVGSTWDEAVELERRLIAPYVAVAVERRFKIEREWRESEDGTRPVLTPREKRLWRSVLAPIYLQLFEALRRISEGEPGATVCRECGRPFLMLDARRRFFCNDRERFRHAQRGRRKRLAAQDTMSISDVAAVHIEHGLDER